MKHASPVPILPLVCFAGLWFCFPARAVVTVVDTFDQGGFSISSPGNSNPADEIVDLPFGQRRYVAFSGNGTETTVMSSILSPSSETLEFSSNGASMSIIFPLSLSLIYSGGDPHSISNDGEFILGFSELSGVGTLYIELGGSLGLEGVTRVDLIGPGELCYPVSSVYAGAGHSLDAFNVLTFRFEARSPEFSFTLDEIRLIPEPSTSLLALAGAAGLLTRRLRG
jgi:hypothetical protein